MSIAFAASPRVGHIDVAPTRYGWPYCTRVWSRLASKLTSGTSTRARLTGQFAVALKACPTKGPKDSALSLTQSLPCRRPATLVRRYAQEFKWRSTNLLVR